MFGILCILNTPAMAAIMIGDDANGANTSFNSDAQLHWSPAGAPSAGNTYSNGGWLLRTPTTAGNYTFAGDSLTIGGPSPHYPFLTDGNVNNNCLINKTPTSPIITVNNLILDAGSVRDGMGSGDIWHLAGNTTVTANGGGLICQSQFFDDSKIMGSGPLYIGANGSGEAARTVTLTSSQSTYDGSIYMRAIQGTGGNPLSAYSRLTFADDAVMNFLIGASGTNNSISGTGTLTLNGDFKVDLSGASTNLGDSWTLASVSSQTFGATFTAIGFTSMGGGLWDETALNGATYEFSQGTGKLTVIPEPATIVMILTGVLGMGMFWLRKRS